MDIAGLYCHRLPLECSEWECMFFLSAVGRVIAASGATRGNLDRKYTGTHRAIDLYSGVLHMTSLRTTDCGVVPDGIFYSTTCAFRCR